MVSDSEAASLCLENSKIEPVATETKKHEFPDESTDPGGWTPLLVLCGATGCLGSALPAGFNIGVINNPANIIKAFCNDSIEERYDATVTTKQMETIWSAVVSIFLIGGVSGSLMAGFLADKFGRRGALAVGHTCGIIGAIMFFVVPALNSIELLMLGRLMVGLSGGLATSLLPMYMTEIAPLKQRGAVGVLCQLGITCGVFFGQVASLDTVLGKPDTWHIMLASFAPLCAIALVLLLFLPESPKYLYIIRGQETKALEELTRLRNQDISVLGKEVRSLQEESAMRSTMENWTIGRLLKDPTLRLSVLLICCLQFGQQLSGINAVFYYSNDIFLKAGLSTVGAQYATLGTGLINIGMAVISVRIMSLFGRRTLFLTSCYTSMGCLVFLTIAINLIHTASFMPWLCVIAVLAYVMFYGIGLGPIPYFIGSELCDVGPRPAAMALGSVFNWGGNFIVGMMFSSIQGVLGAYTFLIFVTCILLMTFFVRVYLPETRGRTTLEVVSTMSQGFKSRPNNVFNA
ncbi:solute carrier family 2, facilitated glucose transporter member 1-like isoform X2 [Venturia canescens]|uniref:solute carrier family 2, facilitated glucose transporter member 1-like isoform X2 n=1 Tax=Venturia canescens TaxID=32260 RepID=UPI001C9C5749|nr:solute carrier family 2, facilitated glucose transporter member 1-like isoform X2 [Venturia canescens]